MAPKREMSYEKFEDTKWVMQSEAVNHEEAQTIQRPTKGQKDK